MTMVCNQLIKSIYMQENICSDALHWFRDKLYISIPKTLSVEVYVVRVCRVAPSVNDNFTVLFHCLEGVLRFPCARSGIGQKDLGLCACARYE